jgi:hypothetical protein
MKRSGIDCAIHRFSAKISEMDEWFQEEKKSLETISGRKISYLQIAESPRLSHSDQIKEMDENN